MVTRNVLICLGALALVTVGCDNTDVSKDANDAYHHREAGGKPPPGAMENKAGPVGPFAKSGGTPPGLNPNGQKPAEAAGPGGK